jgi:hypothetical protein
MDALKDTFIALSFLVLFAGGLSLLSTEYKCQPVEVKDTCRLSRYEVKIHDITMHEKRLIGLAEGPCVYVVGEGRNRRLVMTDARFTAKGRTEVFDKVEFPAAQSLVCEVR